MPSKKFSIEMEVRDNELDAQGIVNNSNYMVYLAHARHKHIQELGINFFEYTQNNQKLVVLSCNLKFKNPLLANDKFIVTSALAPTEYPYQWAYKHSIKRPSDGKTILAAQFYSTCINGEALSEDDRLYIPSIIKGYISE